MMNFTSVAITVADIYQIDVVYVNSCVMCFLMSFVLLNFPSTWAIERNMKATFVLSGVC